jgi:peptidyl-prolyl cis-trans isomerase B (cyclophilin B)
MRRAPAALWMAALGLAAAHCSPDAGDSATREPARPAMPRARIAAGPHDVAVLDLGELGVIRIELLPELAPKTVANFIKLARSGFYDGTYFHRVIPDFMIQGGDPNTRNADPRDDGGGGPGYSIADEFSDYSHVRGTVSMANKGHPNTGASQFFIVQRDSPSLDGKYSVFGRAIEGMEVVDAVTRLEIDVYGRFGPRDRPYPVNATLRSVRIEPASVAEASPAHTGSAAP